MARFHTNRADIIFYERLGTLENGEEVYAAIGPDGQFYNMGSMTLNDVRHRGSFDNFWNTAYPITSNTPFSPRYVGVPAHAMFRGSLVSELNLQPILGSEPAPVEQPQQELVAYVKFFTNARGQLAVAAALTPDALHRANMVDPANEIKRLKIKTTV